MRKRYELFIAGPTSLPEGEEICIFIKDLTPGPRKYDARFVKAVVSSSLEQLSGYDTLQLKSLGGKAYPRTFAIKILEDLGEYVCGLPYSKHTGVFSKSGDS